MRAVSLFKNKTPLLTIALASLLCMSACSGNDEKPPLQGERKSVLELRDTLHIADDANATPIELPQIWKNGFWPQAGGYPNHVLEHVALSAEPLKRIWRTDIGQGSKSRLLLTAQPVTANGKIFTLDTESRLMAHNIQNGAQIWRVDVAKKNERDDEVIGGGVSTDNGVVFVTNGYNEALAVSQDNGEVLWRTSLDAPARAAPTIMDGRVFVTTLNSTIYALNAQDGSVAWDYTTIGETAGLLGAASPAANRDIVVPAFSSGEIYALRVENGSVAWSDNLFGVRRPGSLTLLADIKGQPVIDDGVVYAISYGGKMVAINELTGERLWSKDISGSQTPWVSGNQIYVFSSENQLIALNKSNGAVRWVRQLHRYTKPEERKGAIEWAGPVLAGGRLILVSSDGRMLEVSPSNGEYIRESDIGEPVMIAPIVAGNTLYLLSENGNLLAYQ